MEQGRVRLKTTLKCGKNVWEAGTVFTPPLPPDIQLELLHETGTLEVLGPLKARPVVSNVYSHSIIKPRIIRK